MGDFEPRQFGKYFLLDKVAVGGMAEIYKAKTYGVDGFEKQLCIKRILAHAAADRDFITMLIDEAKLSVLLSHANIVQVYDLGKVGDDYFIAMEFINGVNLRDIMYTCREAKANIPPEICVYTASEVCKGLDYAHRKTDSNNEPLNIVHRDISPQNILISYEGEVKIVDFGIAKAAMNISHTMAGILKGKIAYMSPEQALGKTVDQRTDIFSTGILLYETLTGTKLFTGESQFEVLKKIRTSDITAGTLPEAIPEALKPILAKALASDPEERYQNAADYQIDLTKYLYSNHPDFSPRKLASFINDLFREEMVEEVEEQTREAAHEAQTSSMNIEEGAKQVDIVHRDLTAAQEGTAPIPREKEALLETMVTPAATRKPERPETPTVSGAIQKRGGAFKRIASTIAIIGVLVAGAWLVQKFVPQVRFWERKAPPAISKVTTANVNSEPTGASILVDGRATGLKTPAVIPSLEIGKSYRIRLELANHIPVDQMLTISSPQPLTVTIPLAKESGVLNITSTPPGAAIILNSDDTKQVTPATLEKIPLNVDQRITATKRGFEDAEQIVKLSSSKPQSITFALKEILPDTGSINITSTPAGASITIDGKDVGRVTPAKIVNLKLGKEHTVKLAMKDLEPFEKKFTLKDQKSLPIKGVLKPPTPVEPVKKPVVEKPKPTPKPKPVAKPTEPTTKPTEPTKKPATKQKGTIRVTSNPSGADVFINSELKGRTPLTASVAPGSASVMISKSGFGKHSQRVTVKPGQRVNLTNINLKSMSGYGEVSLNSTPPRATVTFDGQTIPAKTPVTVRKVRMGSHSVTISMPGYRSWTRSFSLDSSSKSFHINLQKQ